MYKLGNSRISKRYENCIGKERKKVSSWDTFKISKIGRIFRFESQKLSNFRFNCFFPPSFCQSEKNKRIRRKRIRRVATDINIPVLNRWRIVLAIIYLYYLFETIRTTFKAFKPILDYPLNYRFLLVSLLSFFFEGSAFVYLLYIL